MFCDGGLLAELSSWLHVLAYNDNSKGRVGEQSGSQRILAHKSMQDSLFSPIVLPLKFDVLIIDIYWMCFLGLE